MSEKTDKDTDAPAGWSKRVVIKRFHRAVLREYWVYRSICFGSDRKVYKFIIYSSFNRWDFSILFIFYFYFFCDLGFFLNLAYILNE